MWAFAQGHEHDYFPDNFEMYLQDKILPLIENSSHRRVKRELKSDEKIQKLLAHNKLTIYRFLDRSGQLYGFTPQVAQTLFD